MTSRELPFRSAVATARAIAAKEVSPVEVVQAYLDRIDRLDDTLHAYITVCREAALDAARPFAEATLLQAAHAYERATSWHQRRAPFAESLT